MPFHHANFYNEKIKRMCECGGELEMIVDFVADFIVRCKKCHVSTHAYMKPEDAITHWDSGDDIMTSPLNLMIDDLEKSLAGEVLYMAIEGEDAEQFNQQSCDCGEVLIVMKDRILTAEHENFGEGGEIGFDELMGFSEEIYNLRIIPAQGQKFEFVKVRYAEDGSVDGVKYRFGDRYVFIFASEHDLIVTKSVIDLFEEEDTPIPVSDPSVLFE